MGEQRVGPGPSTTPTLRRHQGLALEALEAHHDTGRRRSWVVLPPGAGKTLVGLEAIRRRLADGTVDRAVVLGPNTAIQGQWLRAAQGHGLGAAAERDLRATVTALTYQAVAVFDADEEVSDDGEEESLLSRLHENGAALVATLRAAGPILLVLDECHHLLEVWGRLLEEILDELPQAHVLGLTATPPEALSADQAGLVATLFGEVAFEASIPAVVREGDLAPFAELVWLCEPTSVEQEWLASESARFAELVQQLTDPEFGSVPFLVWLDRRFVERAGPGREGPHQTWAAFARDEPALSSAALRMHHAGLLALPDGARLTEEHRVTPTADDWVLLVDDWLRRHLSRTGEMADEAVVEAVRRALPSVGYQWTRRGIRRGRSPVDRVLARSEAKTVATVDIVGHEYLALGERMRMLVLCDHERASAMLPARLDGVLDQQSGSARAVIAALLADPATSSLSPLLVTGRTVAGAPETLAALIAEVGRIEPFLATQLRVETADDGVAEVAGPWRSRVWVQHVTRFFEDGGTMVLVGTRALLGEGWDARRITGLVDLTAATTTTAIVQTRGRALRIDPHWPEKVAINWTVTCVSEAHPNGDHDWSRLVRKHAGFYGVDDDGDVVDGVAHIDPLFSPYAPPAAAEFGSYNARMVVRSQDRDAIRDRWRVGEEYVDAVARTVRIVPRRAGTLGEAREPAAVVVRPSALELRDRSAPGWWVGPPRWWGAAAVVSGLAATVWPAVFLAPLLVAVVAVWFARRRVLAAFGREALAEAARPPGVFPLAAAVADGLLDAGLVGRGAEAVAVEVDHEGEYRCLLTGVDEAASDVFAQALDEVVSPIVAPRYLISRHVVVGPVDTATALRAARGRVEAAAEVWHAVPSVLGVNADRARCYAAAWDRWVGGGQVLYTGSADGAGVLAAVRGEDPFAVTTLMRRQWS